MNRLKQFALAHLGGPLADRVGMGAFAVGVLLLLVNLIGLSLPLRHPDLRTFDQAAGKEFLSREIPANLLGSKVPYAVSLTRRQALEEYKSILNLKDEQQQIYAIQELVTASTVHHWPEQDPTNPHFQVSVFENFVLYALARIIQPLGIVDLGTLRPYEFVDGDKAWKRGAGLCSQLAYISVDLLDEAGIAAGVAELDGHIVALARTSAGKSYVLDADLGFVMPGSLETISTTRIDEIYALIENNGLGRAAAARMSSIYGPEGNVEHWQLGRLYRLERLAYFAKWAIPICLIALGTLLSPSLRQRTVFNSILQKR